MTVTRLRASVWLLAGIAAACAGEPSGFEESQFGSLQQAITGGTLITDVNEAPFSAAISIEGLHGR